MFWTKKIDMDKIYQISCTSKEALLKSCFIVYEGDVKKAKETYEYFANNLELPEKDPAPKSLMDKTQEFIDGISGIYEKNKDGIVQGWQLIQSMRGKASAAPATSAPLSIPPLPLPNM